MKIPFDIKFRPQIQSGEYKVVTRNGSNAEFVGFRGDDMICWVNGAYRGYNRDGTIVDRDYPHYDLFIITPEPELTSWQTFISGCLQKYGLLDCGAADRIAKECSAELLELAKEELEKEGLVTMAYMNIACEAEYQSGLADGKKEALEDLPRWRKLNNIHEGLPYRSLVLYGMDDRKWEIADKGKQIGVLAMYIPIGDLKELPKDYSGELPGLNE